MVSRRHVGGEDGLYATYNELSGGSGDFGWRIGYDQRRYDGTRDNADVDVTGANVSLFWRQSDDASWGFDYTHYESENGEAGRMPGNVYASQPDFTSTPINRLWIERDMGVLSHTRAFNDVTRLDAGRGSEVPVTPSIPTLFYAAGTELLCENVASKVVGSVYQTSDVPGAISAMVSDIMGYTTADVASDGSSLHEAAAAILQEHYDQASLEEDATAALASTFSLACQAPTSLGLGL